MSKVLTAVCLICLMFVAGCGSKNTIESFMREDVDLSYVTNIAVIPFENHSKDEFAAERVRDMAITQILAYGLFDVVDKGLVDSSLRDEAVDIKKAPMDESIMPRLGQRLNVQAFLMGTIDNFVMVQRDSMIFPELSLTLRLIDIETGTIFWQASATRSGDSFGKRIFGFSSDDSFEVSMKLLREMLATISTENKNSIDDEPSIETDVEPDNSIDSDDNTGIQAEDAEMGENEQGF